MPRVCVRNWNLGTQELEALFKNLPTIVSETLHIEEVKEAHLTVEDIEVVIEQSNRDLDIRGYKDFFVTVEAMHFPQREARRNELAEVMVARIKSVVDHARQFSVWLTPPIAGYAEKNLPW